MVTVIDPSGTPIPVYNKSGATIMELSGGATESPTPIPHVSGITIVILTVSSGDKYVELPVDADIGDVVEVYLTTGSPG